MVCNYQFTNITAFCNKNLFIGVSHNELNSLFMLYVNIPWEILKKPGNVMGKFFAFLENRRRMYLFFFGKIYIMLPDFT